MAYSVDRLTKIIFIPKADLIFVVGTLYELNTETFRTELKLIEASEEGVIYVDMHKRNAPYTVAGVTYAQSIEVINGYSVEFENGTYSVRLAGSNNNIFDVENGILVQNTVQVIPQNSAGLVETAAQVATEVESVLSKQFNRVISVVEYQRGRHTHAPTGNIYFWNPINGDDANSGLMPDRPKLTYNGINGIYSLLIANNHDLIIGLPGAVGGTTVVTENIVMDKEFVFFRGPGRDWLFKPSSPGNPTIDIGAAGIELAGCRVETSGNIGSPDQDEAIVVSADFSFLHSIWVEFAGKEGIKYQNSSYNELDKATVLGCGKDPGSSAAAILINGATQPTKYNLLKNLNVSNNDHDGIQIVGPNAVQNYIYAGESGCSIVHNGGWGIYSAIGTSDTYVIGPTINLHGNALGRISLNGISDVEENTEQWATAAWANIKALTVEKFLALKD